MMITWSATFTFLEMKSVWDDREEDHSRKP